jgi:predicted nucleic acid-binding protein
VPFDETAATQFDRLRANKAYRKIGRADLLITNIVQANRATLVTRNVRSLLPPRPANALRHARQWPI